MGVKQKYIAEKDDFRNMLPLMASEVILYLIMLAII